MILGAVLMLLAAVVALNGVLWRKYEDAKRDVADLEEWLRSNPAPRVGRPRARA